VAHLLDSCHANLYERTSDGRTALLLAVFNNHINVAEELLKRGNSCVYDNDVHGSTCIILASQRGNKEMLELLLRYKSEHIVDSKDSKGRSGIHFAASGGHASILSLLLQFGASINAINSNNETALHYACYHGKKDCVQFLLSKGVDTSTVSHSGTALALARSRNHQEIVNLLQQHGVHQ